MISHKGVAMMKVLLLVVVLNASQMSTRYLSLYDQHEEVTGNSLLNDWFQRVGMVLGGAEHVQLQ